MKISLAIFSTALTSLFVGLIGIGLARSSSKEFVENATSSNHLPSQLFVFGDSLSDVGNLYQVTRNRIPASPPYANGHFSNGAIWIELAGTQLQLNPLPVSSLKSPTIPAEGINFALGGATSGRLNIRDSILPGLPHQIQGFLSRLQGHPANPTALYVVWIGANDYIGEMPKGPLKPLRTVQQTIGNISGTLESLLQVGAEEILVFNLPDLGKTPSGQTNFSSYLSTLTQLHNRLLNQLLAILSQRYPNRHLRLVDVNTLFNSALQNPSRFGLTNTTDACLNSRTQRVCTNPDQYLFWDDVHPTRAGHRFIAQTALQVISSRPTAFSQKPLPLQIDPTGNVHRFLPTALSPGIGR